MADVTAGQEIIFRIPRDKVARGQGCGLDFGGSLMKVAYATESDDFVDIHFVTYPYSEKDDVMKFLSDTVCRNVNLDGGVHATGVGGAMMLDQLRPIFQERLTPTSYEHCPSEFTCFVQAIQFLVANISPLERITYPKSEQHMKIGHAVGSTMREFRNVFNSAGKVENSRDINVAGESTLTYPLMVYMCGSAGVPIKVQEDGSLQWLSHNYSGGKHLLAMGCLLTGAKTFEELMQLAASGDSTEVDICGKMYPAIPEECRMYRSGRLLGKTLDDVKKADLAAGLLFSVTRLLAHDAFCWAHLAGCKQVLFVGSLVDHSIIREQMALHIEERHTELSEDQSVDYHFMQNAGFLGAMGALMMGLK